MKELLVKTLEYLDNEVGFNGLCSTIHEMLIVREINWEEYQELRNYLKIHAPKKRYVYNKNFWFEIGLKEPRQEWLEKQIKKFKQK